MPHVHHLPRPGPHGHVTHRRTASCPPPRIHQDSTTCPPVPTPRRDARVRPPRHVQTDPNDLPPRTRQPSIQPSTTGVLDAQHLAHHQRLLRNPFLLRQCLPNKRTQPPPSQCPAAPSHKTSRAAEQPAPPRAGATTQGAATHEPSSPQQPPPDAARGAADIRPAGQAGRRSGEAQPAEPSGPWPSPRSRCRRRGSGPGRSTGAHGPRMDMARIAKEHRPRATPPRQHRPRHRLWTAPATFGQAAPAEARGPGPLPAPSLPRAHAPETPRNAPTAGPATRRGRAGCPMGGCTMDGTPSWTMDAPAPSKPPQPRPCAHGGGLPTQEPRSTQRPACSAANSLARPAAVANGLYAASSHAFGINQQRACAQHPPAACTGCALDAVCAEFDAFGISQRADNPACLCTFVCA
jgi:hypothetical protein